MPTPWSLKKSSHTSRLRQWVDLDNARDNALSTSTEGKYRDVTWRLLALDQDRHQMQHMAGSRDSRPLMLTPEQPSRLHKTPVEASPFSLFAKDLPPITSLHVYAESLSTHSFSPDPTRLPARPRGYGLLSPGAVSRSCDGFDVLASLLPSPLSSPTGPVRMATTSSSVSRLKNSHAAQQDTAAQTLQPLQRPVVGEKMAAKAGVAQIHRLGPTHSAAMTSSAAGNDGPLRSFRRRALNFTEQPPSSSNHASSSQSPFPAAAARQPSVPTNPSGHSQNLLAAPHPPLAQHLTSAPSAPAAVPAFGASKTAANRASAHAASNPYAHITPKVEVNDIRPQQTPMPQIPGTGPSAFSQPPQQAPQAMLRTAASMPAGMSIPVSRPSPPIKVEWGMSQLLETSEGEAGPILRTMASLPVPAVQGLRSLPKPAKRRRTASAITLQTVAPPGTPLPMGRPDTVPDWASKRTRCNCKKTRCLKLYCECFKAGQFCIDCNCTGCGNTDENRTEVTERRVSIQERDPQAFEVKITREKHRQGCNCKKSGCAKKYCECYEAGIMCGPHCKCCNCQNGKDNGHCSLAVLEAKAANALPGGKPPSRPKLPPASAAAAPATSSGLPFLPVPPPPLDKAVQMPPASSPLLSAFLGQQGPGVFGSSSVPQMSHADPIADAACVVGVRKTSPGTPIVETEMPPTSAVLEMAPPLSGQEGSDSAATASPPAMVSHLSSSQDAQSYIGADSMPMVLLPIIHAPNSLSPEQMDAQGWAAAQAQSPWCQSGAGQGSSAAQGDQGSGSGSGSATSAAGTSTPLPQLYQVLLHKTPDGKLVPYGALAGFSQMPTFNPQELPAIKHLEFDEGEGPGGVSRQEEGVSMSPSALPYLDVSPHSMPAAALLASPSGTAPLGSTSLMTNPHPGFMPNF